MRQVSFDYKEYNVNELWELGLKLCQNTWPVFFFFFVSFRDTATSSAQLVFLLYHVPITKLNRRSTAMTKAHARNYLLPVRWTGTEFSFYFFFDRETIIWWERRIGAPRLFMRQQISNGDARNTQVTRGIVSVANVTKRKQKENKAKYAVPPPPVWEGQRADVFFYRQTVEVVLSGLDRLQSNAGAS